MGCIDNENEYLLSASKGVVIPECEAFPHSQTHILSPCHSPVPHPNQPPEVLSTWRLTVHVCAFRTNRCLDIFPTLMSATCSRDALSITYFLCNYLLCHTWEAVPAFGTALCTHFFFPLRLLGQFYSQTSKKKKLSKQLFQCCLH